MSPSTPPPSTSADPEPVEAESSHTNRAGRLGDWIRASADRARDWLGGHRGSSPPLDLGIELYERDRDAFASMFGSAIALRLFLFLVPVMLVVVGVIGAVLGTDAVTGLVHGAGIGGTIAAQLNTAARSAHRTYWVLLGFGIVLTPWAGRGLINVLTGCAAGAWRISRRDTRTSLRSVGAVIALLTLMLVTTFTLNEVRAAAGIVASTAGLIAAAVALGIGWFAVTWSLPRGTIDPGALLPGAALVGAGMAALQWFMQFYLPERISRSSEVMGSLGLSIAILGCMFLAGRLLASSLVLDAVVFERFGSISGVVFALPGLRRLPARFPRLERFFALDPAAPADVHASPPVDADAMRAGSEP